MTLLFEEAVLRNTSPLGGTHGRAQSAQAEGLTEDHRTRVGVARREKMRARLVTAIMELWPQTQSGISVVIDDIVAAAAVSRGSFYRHFASLEEGLDTIGRELADEMTIGIMPVYDKLSNPVHRTAAGFQLFQWRAAFDPVWARFVSRTDHLFRDPELLANVMVDLENGRNAGSYRFESVELAANFVIGATIGGISRIVTRKSGAQDIWQLTEMVLQGLGVDSKTARKAISLTHAHLMESAPDRLGWWHRDSGYPAGTVSTGTDR